MSRTTRLLYIGATLLGAVFVLVYRGPGWPIIRSYLGDWLVVQFIFLIGRFWINFRWRYHWAAFVLILGLVVEVVQYFGAGLIPHSFAAEVTIGSTFDPVDILAYVLGLATVLAIEHVLSRPAG